MTLEERVRQQIGEEGPQLPGEAYEYRIDNLIERMTPAELLRRISNALEEME